MVLTLSLREWSPLVVLNMFTARMVINKVTARIEHSSGFNMVTAIMEPSSGP